MKKEVFIVFGLIFLVSAGVFAETISDGTLSQDVENYVKGFIDQGGINESQVQSVTKVDKNALPNDINIKKIEDNKVGIYKVDYNKEGEQKKVYVITYSTDEFAKKETTKNIQYLNFGKVQGASSIYLDTSAGVESGAEIGYVMMRSGSITGISTSVYISNGNGNLRVKVYKNGKNTGFENLISSQDSKKVDYDLQSEDVLSYKPGDIISVYVEQAGEINWSRMNTMIETTS